MWRLCKDDVGSPAVHILSRSQPISKELSSGGRRRASIRRMSASLLQWPCGTPPLGRDLVLRPKASVRLPFLGTSARHVPGPRRRTSLERACFDEATVEVWRARAAVL